MLKCKSCKKEVYSLINDKCSDCYYNWEAFPLSDKLIIIFMFGLVAIQFLLILGGILNG